MLINYLALIFFHSFYFALKWKIKNFKTDETALFGFVEMVLYLSVIHMFESVIHRQRNIYALPIHIAKKNDVQYDN